MRNIQPGNMLKIRMYPGVPGLLGPTWHRDGEAEVLRVEKHRVRIRWTDIYGEVREGWLERRRGLLKTITTPYGEQEVHRRGLWFEVLGPLENPT